MSTARPAAVIGSGPNGLAAAVTLARAGVDVTVFEAADTLGGGTRTTDFVSPGILHDVCSSIHPLALATGFFRDFDLEKRMNFVIPEASYANPLENSTSRAAVAYRDLDRTAEELGRDGASYRRFYQTLLNRHVGVVDFALGGSILRWPRSPRAALSAGLRTLEQGSPLWNLRFREQFAPALLSGVAAHSIGRMPNLATSAVGVVLGMLGHDRGWPVPVGGSRTISQVMVADILAHGGQIETSHAISTVNELEGFGTVIFDTSAHGLAEIAGPRLPARYVRALRNFKFGDGATRVDFVLNGPIPWADSRVHDSATVHLGGTRAEVSASERQVARGEHPDSPYVLLTQPTSFDPTRNPTGVHAVGTYTHVPNGSTVDMRERVITQISRFAPDFRDRIVAVHQTTAAELGSYNRNYVGGDFSAGAVNLRQLIARPVFSPTPWKTPTAGIYLASSSTPPGPGVHGLSGWYAAREALRTDYGLALPGLGLSHD